MTKSLERSKHSNKLQHLFSILKRPLNLDLIEPLCYIFVKSDLQGYTLFFFLPRRKMKVLIITLHSHYKWTLAL